MYQGTHTHTQQTIWVTTSTLLECMSFHTCKPLTTVKGATYNVKNILILTKFRHLVNLSSDPAFILCFLSKVFSKTWCGKTYEKVFEGSSLVDKLVQQSPEKFPHRDKATELLQRALKEGIIKSIGRSKLFEDGAQLFYWTENLVQPTNNMAATANARARVNIIVIRYKYDTKSPKNIRCNLHADTFSLLLTTTI